MTTPPVNRLASETSPYLRQHMHNPVDWYPWGEEAFAAARTRDVPILLSVGYSTCHWCHVMAHESFENAETAAVMNANFVNIKLDREERPDIDGLYMSAVQAMTGSGGWPMTVFLTHDLRPFYAGTYFPPRDMQGMPSFERVLASVGSAWQTQRDKLESNAEALTAHIREASQPQAAPDNRPPDLLEEAVKSMTRLYDARNGGFGSAPKFPSPTTLGFLLTQPEGRDMALNTLRAMLRGGIYDQLGGGFHRYSVDGQWRVPHFEKMLYDNAQLVSVLLSGYVQSSDPDLLRGAVQTLEYLEREMLNQQETSADRATNGGFYSAQDADTGGIEGLTFVWTPQEFREVLGEEAGEMMQVFGVSDEGNFTDPHHPEFGRRSVLFLPHGLPPHLAQRAELARQRLLAARQQRPQPGTDDKILTSWNGLMLSALATAARITRNPHWLALARQNRDFVWTNLRQSGGALLHTYKDGQAKISGLLEDQALYGLGLVALYRAGGDLNDLQWARQLWETVRRDYWDEDAGVFYTTASTNETLLTRRSEFFDAAVLSSHAAAAQLAVWIARSFADDEAQRIARKAVQTYGRELLAAPAGLGGLLTAAAHLLAPETEIAVVGSPQDRQPFEEVLSAFDLPFTVLASSDTGAGLPVLEGRGTTDGSAVAYVCRGRVCDLPARDATVFGVQVAALVRTPEDSGQ
ncbi:thioredoxin domain-containing protein [Deinococcus sp. KNUC1210]|uniref:thioredoxin domain-containing protein n=1 Tax=Deinococcus sp. KNUC1210 TaxID=2917691 RepID=UPI001EEF9655|nr:thioredoxin domain-containing protein [Deinococcus sp. KNUC1210]ULH14404.1 thioredoxin domain-containing protein [Deinococcus sp. KNUC1210]